MFSFFDKVCSYLETAFQFLVNTISALIKGVWFLGQASNFPMQLVPLVPSVIGSAILITFAVCVIKFLIGR